MAATKIGLSLLLASSLAGGVFMLSGCATSPQTEPEKRALSDDVNDTLHDLKDTDPSLEDFLNNAYGYVVFPSIGKGGAGLAFAYGRGEVFEQGKMVGYADLSQGSIGATLGGETYREIIAFENQDALNNFESNKLEFEAGAGAVALKAGAAAAAKYTNGVAVFTMPTGGLMFDAQIGGQQFTYQPLSSAPTPQGASNANPSTQPAPGM